MIVNIEEIKYNDKNPRVIKDYKFQKLVKSIKDFPEMLEKRPIVVDENMVVLGGNMRLRACHEAGFTTVHIVKAEGWTDKQKEQFIIKDNSNFGEWDWDILANNYLTTELEEWGFDTWQNIDDIETSDTFNLPNEDKSPYQQQTYTFSDMQANYIKQAINKVKKTDEYKSDTFNNSNSNANALYYIVKKWMLMNN